MLAQLLNLGTTIVIVLLVIVGIIVIYILKNLVVVPLNQIHVVTRGEKMSKYDGAGRYIFVRFLNSRTIIPKHVLDIEPQLIKLHDVDKLPFGVEVSIKVQVVDAQKAAQTLTAIDFQTVSKIVEDTVMSAARSVAMERTILDIMKNREEIEVAIYRMISDALAKLGLAAIIFDIKNIRDIEGSEVIGTLERVKIAELRKTAAISESFSEKEAKVKSEQMKQEEETARLIKEQDIATRQKSVDEQRLFIEQQKTMRLAEIEKEKVRILAEAEHERISQISRAESDAVKVKADAEAEGIRKRGIAEADVLQKRAEAMNASPYTAQLKMVEILADAQIKSAEKIAEALGKNNKIIYLPMGADKNLLSNFVPQLDAIIQSGIFGDLSQKFRNLNGTNPSLTPAQTPKVEEEVKSTRTYRRKNKEEDEVKEN